MQYCGYLTFLLSQYLSTSLDRNVTFHLDKKIVISVDFSNSCQLLNEKFFNDFIIPTLTEVPYVKVFPP
jgi:hypothetical protein